MTISEAMETTISEAIRAGIVDPRLHAGPLEALRRLAEKADAMEGDNVTLPTMLKYLASLGIVDKAQAPAAPRAAQPEKTKLEQARERRMHVA